MFARFVKVGPKGQIVIPKVFRDGFDIHFGSEVPVEYRDDGILIYVEKEGTEEIFGEVALSGNRVKRNIGPHEAYGSQLKGSS